MGKGQSANRGDFGLKLLLPLSCIFQHHLLFDVTARRRGQH
jgi:hypothetical protein